MGGAATALFVGLLLGPWVIAKLRSLRLAQEHRDASEIGALAEHSKGKRGTPSMGGLLVCLSITSATMLWARPNLWVLTSLLVYLWLTAVGFVDDWSKISRKGTKGLSARGKLLWQSLLVGVVFTILSLHPASSERMLEFWIPFLSQPLLAPMPAALAFVLLWFTLVGFSNAINLTDGLDGLAIGCTISVALAFGIMAYAAGNAIIANYLFVSHVPGTGELAVICGALVGAGLAFLWYNAHPAQVFMGDTGSLALGGLIGMIAFLIHQPITLVVVGGIFVMEAASVAIQVISYKTRGKRVFKMSPIHHHFQLCGWTEPQVVIRFWILSLIFALGGLATLKLR
jgi:phospho-N-acetylmuramoyl-pentapeptide-transferase